MSSAQRDADRRGELRAVAEDRFVVQVVDEVDERIAGHAGCAYASPAQPFDDALSLVRVLIGRPVGEPRRRRRWTSPIAGGQRTVTMARSEIAP